MSDLAPTIGKSFASGAASPPLVEVTIDQGAAGTLDALAALADPRHAFLRASWFAAAAGSGLRTLVARRADGTPLAALPIERRNMMLSAVPGSYWPLRSFPIAADAQEAELAALLSDRSARRVLGPLWRLGPVRADDPSAARLFPIAAASGWSVLTRTVGTAFILDLADLRADGPWPKGATLKKNRQFERKLAAEGELEFHHLSGAGWTPELFDALAAIESNSWIASKTDGSGAKFMAPHHRRFWEAASADPLLAGQMHASLMLVAGVPAAFSFWLRGGASAYNVANSYDERFRQHSPGRVLLYRDFQRLAEDGVAWVDWGAGDPGYKSDMGAVAGPAILDHLFVRSSLLARLIRPLWRG